MASVIPSGAAPHFRAAAACLRDRCRYTCAAAHLSWCFREFDLQSCGTADLLQDSVEADDGGVTSSAGGRRSCCDRGGDSSIAALQPGIHFREQEDVLHEVEACQLGRSSDSDKDEESTEQDAGADVDSMNDMEGEDIEGEDKPRSTHECVTCFEPKEEAAGAQFTCSHSGQFCARCIAKLQMPSCPLCRRVLVQDLAPWFRRVVRHHEALQDKAAHLDIWLLRHH